ncbi:hypothetical protein ACQP1V_25005 [Microtetraspora malaysiensis]|uniref:hypothetical protein n=1 Tax=Microtetraspora malaysiensis TaxID=161358 RepID=UPI003D9185A2
MNRRASRPLSPGLLAIAVLLPLMGALLALQAALDSTLLWVLFLVVGFTIFIVGVVTAASAARRAAESGAADAADAARLEELEPLPPTAGDEGDRQ